MNKENVIKDHFECNPVFFSKFFTNTSQKSMKTTTKRYLIYALECQHCNSCAVVYPITIKLQHFPRRTGTFVNADLFTEAVQWIGQASSQGSRSGPEVIVTVSGHLISQNPSFLIFKFSVIIFTT